MRYDPDDPSAVIVMSFPFSAPDALDRAMAYCDINNAEVSAGRQQDAIYEVGEATFQIGGHAERCRVVVRRDRPGADARPKVTYRIKCSDHNSTPRTNKVLYKYHAEFIVCGYVLSAQKRWDTKDDADRAARKIIDRLTTGETVTIG